MKRALTIAMGQNKRTLEIEISYPVCEKTGSYFCSFSIGWPSGTKIGKIYGVDDIQSLLLTFNMIAFFLYNSEFHKSGNLYWEVPGEGFGFPLSDGFKDMAVGSDKLL